MYEGVHDKRQDKVKLRKKGVEELTKKEKIKCNRRHLFLQRTQRRMEMDPKEFVPDSRSNHTK
jgi:hypothetical protein